MLNLDLEGKSKGLEKRTRYRMTLTTASTSFWRTAGGQGSRSVCEDERRPSQVAASIVSMCWIPGSGPREYWFPVSNVDNRYKSPKEIKSTKERMSFIKEWKICTRKQPVNQCGRPKDDVTFTWTKITENILHKKSPYTRKPAWTNSRSHEGDMADHYTGRRDPQSTYVGLDATLPVTST